MWCSWYVWYVWCVWHVWYWWYVYCQNPCLLLLAEPMPAATAGTHACCYCLLLQELCEGDLMDFTRKVRDMLYGQDSKMASVYSLAPILLVRAPAL